MKTALLTLLVFCFCPHLARGEPVESARADTDVFPANCSIAAPDISDWEVVKTPRTEFRISDLTVAYLGLAIEYADYRNPLNGKEFVRVFSRHIPLIPEQKDPNERVILDVVIMLYNQKEERERLAQLEKESDVFLFMRWRTGDNIRTGGDMLDGDVDLWFLKSDGGCLVAKNEKVTIQFSSENVGNGKPRNVFVGVQYSIEIYPDENICSEDESKDEDVCKVQKFYHILKVDRRDVLQLTNGRER